MAIARSQVGYRTDPTRSYCNRFSAYWRAVSADCRGGDRSEERCADFAVWVWQQAGVRFSYGENPGQLNAGAVSSCEWGVARGH